MSVDGDLLDAWEAAHGPLDPKWVADFFEHPSLERLVRAPRNCALNAVRTHKRLEAAADYAEELARDEAQRTRQRLKVPGTPITTIDEIVAIYERFVLQRPLPPELGDAFRRSPALPRMIGFKQSKAVEAALRLDPPVTPSMWLAELCDAERRASRSSAGSVLDGRMDKFDHRPSRPGGVYTKGDI